MATRAGTSRRAVLKSGVVALASTAGVHLAGCRDDRRRRASREAARPRTFAENLATLVVVVGPWPEADVDTADAFVARYVATRRGRFEPSAAALDAVVDRLPIGARQLGHIGTSRWAPAEVALLREIVTDLYSIAELRWYLDGIAAPGVCIGSG